MVHSYIINLEDRLDRKSHILTEITKLPSISHEIVAGIRDETKTCFQSHMKCIQLAKENKLPYILILEDDAVFIDGANDILCNVLNEVQQYEWDMFYLGANLQQPTIKVSETLLKLTGAYTTHAYMVHERFYDTLLNLSHLYEIDMHYNELMPKHNIYMCNPIIAYQLPSYSDLQNGYRDYNEAMVNNYLRFKS